MMLRHSKAIPFFFVYRRRVGRSELKKNKTKQKWIRSLELRGPAPQHKIRGA